MKKGDFSPPSPLIINLPLWVIRSLLFGLSGMVISIKPAFKSGDIFLIRYELWARADMNGFSAIKYANVTTAEFARFFDEILGYQLMRPQKIFNRIRVKSHNFIISLVCVFDFFDFFLFAGDDSLIDHRCHFILDEETRKKVSEASCKYFDL